jgi:hypothetical protein
VILTGQGNIDMARILFLLAALFAAPASTAFAGAITLKLSSTDDLLNLTTGQVVTIDVNLVGLDPLNGDYLELLTADVLLPAGIFGIPTVPVAGDIISAADAANPFAFNSQSYTDLASVGFFGLDPIESNGVFFSFQATVIQAGTGLIEIDNAITPPQVSGNLYDIDTVFVGAGLEVVATGAALAAVPEPTTFAVWTLLASAGIALRRRRCCWASSRPVSDLKVLGIARLCQCSMMRQSTVV